MLGLLLGCRLRRSEVVGLRLDPLQLRESHWVVVDLVGRADAYERCLSQVGAKGWWMFGSAIRPWPKEKCSDGINDVY